MIKNQQYLDFFLTIEYSSLSKKLIVRNRVKYMLTEQQYKHFQTFGFLILPKLFSQEELQTIETEFEHGLKKAYFDNPFDGTCRHWTTMMGAETPFFAHLLEDSRFCQVAEQIYGEDVMGVGCDANRYVGNTNWHPDHHVDPIEDCYGVKFAYYLEPVGAQNGALRLIPGSHKNPLHDDLRENLDKFGLEICDVPAYTCELEPGDVVAFDMRCWHASWGGAIDRRMCTVVYYNNPKTPEEEEATRNRAGRNAQTPTQFQRPEDPLYPSHWIANAEESPKRQKWINRMSELGFFEPV